MKDKALITLALVGLLPTLLWVIPMFDWGVHYFIALYFSCIWGLFFYYLFKTNQVSLKSTVIIFFLEQGFIFLVWGLLGIPSLNPFYYLKDAAFPVNIVGYVLGVGLPEEFAKLQIFAIYFAIPTLFGVNLDRMAATIVAFSLNYAAYFAEIFRGGIMGIPVGQHEASQMLGFTKAQTFFYVVLPQVFKRVLLPVSNEVITLVKDTSLANIIAVSELFRAAKNEASRTASVEPLFVAGLFYLIMNGAVTLVFSALTKRMDYYKD